MSNLSSYTKRNVINETLCNLAEEYLLEKDKYPTDTVLVIDRKIIRA